MVKRIHVGIRKPVMRAGLALLCAAVLLPGEPALWARSPEARPVAEDQTDAKVPPDQLDSLVAPIALYPDPLLGQILAASTYPLEIAEAAQWLQQNQGLHGQQLMDAARQQNWDPSVQALVAFPDVLTRLNSDIRWTTDIGNAFLAQQADVMAAVQRMRARAQANGKLSSNAQETVTTQTDNGQEAIDIEPANPDVVYVPYYSPEYIWGPPAWGYYPAWDDWDFGFGWGPGIYIGGFFPGWGGWGGWGWGCNWFGGFLYNRPFFFSHYGFHGYRGGHFWGHNQIWAHNGAHRMGVAYPNRGLTARYGASSRAGRVMNGSHFTAPTNRAFSSGAGGWNHFSGSRAANGARAGAYGGNAYRGNAYRGNAYSGNAYRGNAYAGNRGAGSYGRTYNNIAPRTTYGAPRGGYNYGGSRGYTVPRTYSYGRSYGGGYSAPHYSGGGAHYGGGAHFGGGGGGFHSSGGGFHGGGGGGGFHGGGGGHGGHR